METSNKTTYVMSRLDANCKNELIQMVEEANKSSQPTIIELMLEDVNGDLNDALEIIQAVHTSDYADFHTHAKGKNDRSGTLLTASGVPGSRSADSKATFELLIGNTYPSSVEMDTLREEDETFIETLVKLTGRRKMIFEAITKAKTVNGVGAQKLHIIDIRPVFKSKYVKPRNKK